MPDFYLAIENDIDDIALGLRVLDSKARDVRGAVEQRQALSLQRAATDLARFAGQLGALADGLAARTGAKLRAQAEAQEDPAGAS
jgi:hypothetical protein